MNKLPSNDAFLNELSDPEVTPVSHARRFLTCDIPGCKEFYAVGLVIGDEFKWLCKKHHKELRAL